MRVPLSWLTDFTPIDVDVFDADAIRNFSTVLDGLGLVVEGVETIGGALPGVVLARIVEINAIEGADRVRQVFVDDGTQSRLEIVCGATNFALGDVVPLATIGTELPGGMVISERKMRGATSHGMLCSGRELELDDDAAGLLIIAAPGGLDAPLPEAVVLGRRLDDYLGLKPEVVFDVAIEPNRPDCLSIVGIARDVAAKLGLPFSYPTPHVEERDVSASARASVEIAKDASCSALVGRVLEGVSEFASPAFVQQRLALAGMRPISAVVDASNYVMLEFGQPTHAYDLDTLSGHGIRVRMANVGERLTTLDGIDRILGQERLDDGDVVAVADMVITDLADTVVGLAGVMGGASTEITPSTTNVLVEVACFDSITVGRTSARLGLRSEASARFWRGVDPTGLERAADRFCELVQLAAKEAGVSIPLSATGRVRAERVAYSPLRLSLRVARVNALLGTELSPDEISALLSPIGFELEGAGEVFEVEVPPWRGDVTREVNLIEEVARHFGYDRIGKRERRSPHVGAFSNHQARRRTLRSALIGAGINEAWTSSIVDPATEIRTGALGPFIELTNPIVQGETVLRSGLLGGMLSAIVHNEAHRNGDIRLFEVGKVFGTVDVDGRPFEQEHLGVALAAGEDAKDAMALFARLVEALGIDPDGFVFDQGEFRAVEDEALATGMHPTRSALVMARRADPRTRPVLAVIGEVDPRVLTQSGVNASRVGFIVAELEGLFSLPLRSQKAAPVSKYPSSDIDLAFLLDEDVPADRLEETLVKGAGELLQHIQLIDVYRGDAVAVGTRSLAFRLRLGALDRTLTDAELAAVRLAAIDLVEKRLPARLRS